MSPPPGITGGFAALGDFPSEGFFFVRTRRCTAIEIKRHADSDTALPNFRSHELPRCRVGQSEFPTPSPYRFIKASPRLALSDRLGKRNDKFVSIGIFG
jgi:hypothetical protein